MLVARDWHGVWACALHFKARILRGLTPACKKDWWGCLCVFVGFCNNVTGFYGFCGEIFAGKVFTSSGIKRAEFFAGFMKSVIFLNIVFALLGFAGGARFSHCNFHKMFCEIAFLCFV